GDPRSGEAATDVYRRFAVALSARDPHGVPGMQRQLGADVLQRTAAGHRPGAARPRLKRRMDRRTAVDAARRDWHRSESEVAPRRGFGFARPAPQRADEEGAR